MTNNLQPKTTKKASILLEQFNECPGAAQFMREMREANFTAFEFVDSNKAYYQNNHDTAVFTVPQNAELLKLLVLVHAWYPDEVNYYFDNNLQSYVMRLWWD